MKLSSEKERLALEAGEMLNAAREAFVRDEELRFRFQIANQYLNHLLRERYEADASIRQIWPTITGFTSAAKVEASRLLAEIREKAAREAIGKRAVAVKAGPVGRFVNAMLARD